MPSIDTTLAWATPVKVEHLGAHLEAYINLLPTIHTLRLCHRYGKGPHATVAKLPVELVAYIEDYLVANERRKARRQWSQDFKCFQLLCSPDDHLTTKQYQHYCKLLKVGALDIPETSRAWPYDEEDGDDWLIHYHLCENQGIWIDVHSTRLHRWEDRTGRKTCDDRGFLTANRDLVLNHFGLDIWLSHLRLPDYQSENDWAMCDEFPAETTIAYFKMPDAQRTSRAWGVSDSELNYGEYHIESGLGMEVTLPKRLSKPSRARFRRAMKILALDPYMHPTQRDVPDAVGEVKASVRKPKRWPRRMMLIKNNTTSYD